MKKFKFKILSNLVLSLVFSSILTLFLYIISYYLRLFSYVDLTTKIIILSSIFLITLLLSFSSMLNYSLSYIDKLISTVKQIASGDFNVAIPIEQDDEFNYIANHINQMAYDLKKAKEKEAQAIHKERLYFLTQQKEEQATHDLITNVAHDLKTPLTSLMGYLQLLNDHPDYEEEKKNKYIKIAYDKCVRLNRLINDLFNYSAFSSKQIQFDPKKINISELVSQIAEEYYDELQKHELTLETNISNPNIYVSADGELLARVFDNLFSNAIKYHLDKSPIYLNVEEDIKTVTIKISNRSESFTKEELDHLFEKFYRHEKSRSSTTGGTGLGLAIAKSIIEMHKGEIFATYRHELLNMIVVLKKQD